jgi:serine/threonine-protein kinase
VPAEAASAGRASASASATWSSDQPALARLRPQASGELAPGDCVGEYVIERRIGAGGMGTVYGARHPVIGKRAAIKILNARLTADDDALSRFVLEAQAVNKIGHASIVDIFGFGTLDDGRSYFAMEWLQGETLGERLQRGRLTVREAAAILSPLCRALEAAHAAGVIHRDLKPDNVFLATDDDGWRVKLLDFGVAKLSSATAAVSRTATGVAMGTPLYMAPEQARGETVDGRTDVYALGLVAYAMVCGVSLFEDAGSAIEILAAHIARPPVPPRARVPDLPAAFEALILEMIAKQPDHRPAPSEIRGRLAAIATAADRPGPPAMAGPPTMPARLAGLPASRPPTMPGAVPIAPDAAQAPDPVAIRPSAIHAPITDEPPAGRRSPMPGAVPIAPDAHDPAITTGSRRPRWPVGLAALVAVAVAVAVAVVAGRGSSEPTAARASEAPAVQPQSAPTAARASEAPAVQPQSAPAARPAVPEVPAAPTPAAAPPPDPAQVTAELAVEPTGARLVVDGQPVAVVAGRATIALPPGDHEALASAGGRVARQRFTITAGRAARVALRVPVAPAAAAPRPAAHGGDDVDGVEDPFRK